MNTIRIRTEKLIFGGQALGRLDGKTCLVWNALPGEEVTARIVTEKTHFLEALAIEVHEPSPERVIPRESHFLACSPWQILSWDAENRWKAEIALETYRRVGRLKEMTLPQISTAGDPFGYRNKLEYHFTDVRDPQNKSVLYFGIHQRESHDILSVKRCELAGADIHRIADHLLEWLRASRIPASTLDELIIRSNKKGQTLSVLSVQPSFDLSKVKLLHLDNNQGFEIHRINSTIRTPKKNQVLWQSTENSLTTEVLGTPIQSGPRSFFQVNLPAFEQALKDMAEFITPQDHVIDYYAGVGAISLPLASRFASALLVESHPEAVRFARKNIAALNLAHCQVREGRSENSSRFMEPGHILILDPPRAGLEEAFTRKILSQKPVRILYLSCDVATQARDIARLSGSYIFRFTKIYNFFPRTPHFEALCVLDRIVT